MYGKGKVDLLTTRTLKELNIDPSTLRPKSHVKVYVRCTRCGEELLRPFALLHQFHACPTHIVRADGLSLKWCNGCGAFLPYKAFGTNSCRYDKLASMCTDCMNQRPSARRNINKVERRTPIGWLKWAISRKRSECKKHGITFDIDFDYILTVYEEQEGKCFYAKIPLEFGTNGLRSASLERLDSTHGYVRGNVVLASKAMNHAKNRAPKDDFINFISQIMESFAIRVEMKRLHPDAIVPIRKRSTDAGYDVAAIHDATIKPHGVVNVDTGLAVSPPIGTYCTVEGRSSLWSRGIVPCRGIIDGTYEGPLMVALLNGSDSTYQVKKGDRIAQLVFHRIIHADFTAIEEFSPTYDGRGAAGFGSTGR